MKKIAQITIIVLLAGIFQACNSHKPGDSADSTAAINGTGLRTADSTNKKSPSLQANPDTDFANKAEVSGMAEVALGKLAYDKTANMKLKDFASMMVNDHNKANRELMALAKTKNITLPANTDAEHQVKIDSLGKLSGVEFNKAFVLTMVAGHQKTLSLMQQEAANGKDAELKAFAAKTTPIVKMHLDAINKIHDSMK